MNTPWFLLSARKRQSRHKSRREKTKDEDNTLNILRWDLRRHHEQLDTARCFENKRKWVLHHNVCNGICKPGFFDYYISEESIVTLTESSQLVEFYGKRAAGVSNSNNLCWPVALERTNNNNNAKNPTFVSVSSPLPWPHWGLTHALVDVFSHACSRADKILRRTSSDILQICCLGCCTGILNAAATWTVWMASRENGIAFHSSS